MSRGRTPREAAILRRAVSSSIESLEPRRMLTTLFGGDTFDYLDAEKNVVRIQLVGDIVAEFIAMRIRESNNTQVVRDLVPAPPDPDDFDTVDGADLFHIYIAAASRDAQIIITNMTDDRDEANPFSESVGQIQVSPSEGGENIRVTPTGGGQVYIGARTRDIEAIEGSDEADLPITYTSRRADYGVRPGSRGIYAGVQTAEGVSFDKLLIGGTVTGRVYLGGSLNTFYAGDLLVGDTSGTFGTSSSNLPNNFFVAGDLRNFLVQGSVGTVTDQDYRTAVDIRVGGKLGNFKVGETNHSVVEVVNNPDLPLNNAPFEEVEYKLLNGETVGEAFLRGNLSGAFFDNDSLTDRFFGSSFASSLTGKVRGIDFAGSLDSEAGDSVDYFSLPLIAGQEVIIQLLSDSFFNLGVFDPLGRLIQTDFTSGVGGGNNSQFVLKATLPGTYQLAVTTYHNSTFGGSYVPAAPAAVVSEGFGTYQVVVQNYGEVAFGGASVGGETKFADQQTGLLVRTGDMGTWESGGDLLATFFSPISIARGNLRHLGGANIGTDIEYQPDLLVPRGSVGLIRTTADLNINPGAFGFGDEPVATNAVGFDYQWLDVAGNMNANLSANRAIGTIQVGGNVGTVLIYANADRRGQDGRIDLIDVQGDFGNALSGGPGLFTGLGGNVKYIRVGGNTFRDRAFGGRQDVTQLYPLKQPIMLQDDSGARAYLTPTTIIDRAATAPGNGNGNGSGSSQTTWEGQIEVTGYPVREAAGLVIIKLRMGTGLVLNAQGNTGQFDIGEIETEFSDATPLVFNEDTNRIEFDNPTTGTGNGNGTGGNTAPQPSRLTPNLGLNFTFNGKIPVNVLSLQAGIDRLTPGLSSISTITNNTSGELVGVRASSIGTVIAQSVGVLHNTTGVQPRLMSNFDADDIVFPYDSYSYGVYSTGPIRQIFSREDIGVVRSNEEIGEIRANADGKNSGPHLEGITAPIYGSVIQVVNVGEGLAFGGTGDVVGGGIYATESIGQVAAFNADIRGYIIANEFIENIYVKDGSLVGARVGTLTTFAESVFYNNVFQPSDIEEDASTADDGEVDPNNPDAAFTFTPHYSLKNLSVSGNGGILGSQIIVGDFQNIAVDGFGILQSTISALSQFNPSGRVTTTGLGLRDSTLDIGGSLSGVYVKGMGELLDVRRYNAGVRQAERSRYDAQSGRWLDLTTDLHRFLGTSRGTSKVSGVTNAGILEDTVITGVGNLGSVEAYLIRDGVENDIQPNLVPFPMRIFMGTSTGKIKATNAILGLKLVTGRVDLVTAGGNMQNTQIDATGRIGDIVVGRNIRGTTSISAKGPQGSINRIYARGSMYGGIESAVSINSIEVGTLGGDPAKGIRALNRIESLRVGGDVVTGTYVRAAKGMGTLFVGGNIQSGSKISARSFGATTILGTNNGQVVIE